MRIEGALPEVQQSITGVLGICPICGAAVADWAPWKVIGRLAVVLYPCRHQINDVEMIFPPRGEPPK